METRSLKEKLVRSRELWSAMNHANFLVDLYETLDNPLKDDIITWSVDGKVLLIKDLSQIDEEVLPYFETCHTTQQFLSTLEACKFFKVSGKKKGVEYSYKHKHFNRDSRPIFECFDDNRKLQNQATSDAETNEIESSTARKKLKAPSEQEGDGQTVQAEEILQGFEQPHRQSLKTFYDYNFLETCFQSVLKDLNFLRQLQQTFGTQDQ